MDRNSGVLLAFGFAIMIGTAAREHHFGILADVCAGMGAFIWTLLACGAVPSGRSNGSGHRLPVVNSPSVRRPPRRLPLCSGDIPSKKEHSP